jgi:hypothetical protein
MALTTVQIDDTRNFVGLKIGGSFRIRQRHAVAIALGLRVVVMLMVTEMPRHNLLLMPAVGRDCRPAELERQKKEKEEGKAPAHVQEFSGCGVGTGLNPADSVCSHRQRQNSKCACISTLTRATCFCGVRPRV